MLGRGALAVAGHVDAALISGFQWPGASRNVQAFESFLRGITGGMPIGLAMSGFAHRYAEIATAITDFVEPGAQRPVTPADAEALWMAHNDSKAYGVFGDPAARLRLARRTPRH
jgi:hypothetical protein